MTRRLSLAAGLVLCSAPTFGIVDWDNPRQPRGFLPQEALEADSNGSDATSPFSGGVGMTIPIGQAFHVGGGLTWQLSLTYSSSIWRYTAGSDGSQSSFVSAAPDDDFNAGAGWLLSLGKVYKPNSGANTSGDWIYVSPSGSRHKFFQQLHSTDDDGSTSHYYTRDGSVLRLNKTSTVNPTVEFPDGTIHTFDTNNGGRITSIKNRFKVGSTYQNVVTIAYPTSTQWTIGDGTRTVTVNLSSHSGGRGTHVSNIVVPTFAGGSHTYTFEYQDTSIRRTCYDTWWQNNVTPGSASAEEAMVNVALLRKIDGPGTGADSLDWKILASGSTTTADYHRGGLRGTAECSFSGVIESAEYPTKTRTTWTWQKWAFPPIGKEYLDYTVGVKTRTVTSPVSSINPSGVWDYTPVLLGPPTGAKEEIHTKIEDPEGNDTHHYFRAQTTTPTPWDYGLPFTVHAPGAGPQDGKYLSTQIYDSGANQVLTTRLEYAHDPLPGSPTGSDNLFTNRRVKGQRIEYKNDGSHYKDVGLSNFDGVGHYRVTNTSDTFGSTPMRTERVNWNPNRECYSDCAGAPPFNDPDPADDWVFGVFDFARQDEDGQKIYQDFSFNGSTGYLDEVRIRKNVSAGSGDPAQSDTDVIAQFCSDSRGNTNSERWYGGDKQSLSGATLGCGNGSTTTYRIDSAWNNGTRIRSTYTNDSGVSVGFDSYTGLADQKTGLLSRVCDSTGYCTELDYDDAGRLTDATPVVQSASDAGAVIHLSHNFGSTINQWYTNVTMTCPVGSPTACNVSAFPQEKRYFDGFGRLHKTERLNADASWSKQVAGFSKTGALRSVSEWIPLSLGDLPANTNPSDGASSIAPDAYTIFDNRDAFGRPRIVWRPDGKKISLDYAGIRKLDTTVSIATALDGSETLYTTTRTFDRNGRVVKVEEPANPNGSLTTATSSYFVAGGLKQILHTAGVAPNLITQTRSYTYDGRGFLQSETIPERTGTVTFGLYDARGHLGLRLDGSGSAGVLLTWDRAERPMQLQEVNSDVPGNLIKTFQYDTAVGRGLGKLAVADSYNAWTGVQGSTLIVRQTYEYQGIGGAVTKRKTGFHDASNDFEQFDTTLSTDPAGQVTSIGYPTCTGGDCGSPGAPSRASTAAYVNGWLGSVDSVGFSYHTNGMLSQVAHPNGVDDNYSINGTTHEQRLLDWGAWYGATPLALSGQFDYDGAGNIESIGPQTYRYDGVSRLVQSEEWRGGPAITQSTTFDGFGNIQQITTQGTGLSTPTSGSTNRLTSAATTYDVEGNLTSWNGATYAYDRLNRLASFTPSPGAQEWVFAYSADDERVLVRQKSLGYIAGQRIWTIRGLDGQVLREFKQQGPTLPAENYKDYIWRGRSLVRTIEPVMTGGVRTGDEIFDVSVDHLGSPHIYTRADGSVSSVNHYYPFGQELVADTSERMRFTGHERDGWDTGIAADDVDYMHARSYQPTLARFMQVDPLAGSTSKPQSLNRFSYVMGNPIRYWDARGFCGESLLDPCPAGPGEEILVTDGFDPNAPPPTEIITVPESPSRTDDAAAATLGLKKAALDLLLRHLAKLARLAPLDCAGPTMGASAMGSWVNSATSGGGGKAGLGWQLLPQGIGVFYFAPTENNIGFDIGVSLEMNQGGGSGSFAGNSIVSTGSAGVGLSTVTTGLYYPASGDPSNNGGFQGASWGLSFGPDLPVSGSVTEMTTVPLLYFGNPACIEQ